MTKLITDVLQGREDKVLWKDAVQALRNGGLVVFPTETVYGLGANALLSEAVSHIFQAKGRPSDNPLIVHGADLSNLTALVEEFPLCARKLAKRFWPGPLTMILPSNGKVSEKVTAGLKTVALRIPGHPVALRLLSEAGVPVAAPSANISGKPSPTLVEHVIKDLGDKVDYIIDGGPCQVGLESTVVDISSGHPVILRPGGISREELAEVCGYSGVEEDNYERPRAPGMKYRHYAPRAELIIIEPQPDMGNTLIAKVNAAKTAGKKVGVLAYGISSFDGADAFGDLGEKTDLPTAARRLFALLREMDEKGVELIIVEGVIPQGLGLAIMNRLRKAASKGR